MPVRYSYGDAKTVEAGNELENNDAIPALPEDADFSGRKILIVDDDIRNIFAIHTVLEARGMDVLHAENGKQAIALLKQHADFDMVLMDTMMPEMDGLEATQSIRVLQEFRNLPVISLTAKAMKGDREKALAAGASDYVTKPVDPDKLLSAMHKWLKKPGAGR
jgi:CheY-like chemotaxis protein